VYHSNMATAPKSTTGHGGYRPGAGAKPPGYVPPKERIDLDREKARNEKAKADLNELELAVRRGEYVERAQVRQASATALSALAQTLRSVPDNLERKLGVAPEVAQEVGMLIDAALDEVANQFEAITEQARAEVPEVEEPEDD
jgi:phage terminase Nu1 subunit (DNA packaging protein)